MAPFRPANLNKRAYPGNANVIGPTIVPSCVENTTTCESLVLSTVPGAEAPILGCRCTYVPTISCCRVCRCNCTVCTRTTPSGFYKSNQVWTARKNDTWGPSSSCNTAATCVCCTNCTTSINSCTDMKGFYICKGPEYWHGGCDTAGNVYNWAFCDYTQDVCVGGCADPCSGRAHPWSTGCHGANACWYVAPSCTQSGESFKSSCNNSTNWCALNSAITQMGDCGWCIPGRSWMPSFGTPRGLNCAVGLKVGYHCRTYWDSYSAATYWSSHRAYIHSWGPDSAGSHGPYMTMIDFNNGFEQAWYNSSGNVRCTRAFRVVDNGVNTTVGHNPT